mmetsp:Transcript_12821/g.37635  ORF Transcript_12821/g.37635 Transcript_12821/m.37635 type:complete len:202 (-) Transcript_12821:1777-2382(-)
MRARSAEADTWRRLLAFANACPARRARSRIRAGSVWNATPRLTRTRRRKARAKRAPQTRSTRCHPGTRSAPFLHARAPTRRRIACATRASTVSRVTSACLVHRAPSVSAMASRGPSSQSPPPATTRPRPSLSACCSAPAKKPALVEMWTCAATHIRGPCAPTAKRATPAAPMAPAPSACEEARWLQAFPSQFSSCSRPSFT